MTLTAPTSASRETDHIITLVSVTAILVKKVLREVDAGKATSPDTISPQVLKNCVEELSKTLAYIFAACLEEKKWPSA